MTPRWASLVGGQAMRAVGWARRMPRAVRRVVRPPLTVAIVGCGAIAPTHVAAYHDSGLARVVGVSDVRVPPLADALDRWPRVRAYRNYRQMLSDLRPDLVSVCIWPDDHAEAVIAADRPFKDAKNELIDSFEKGYLQDLLARNNNNISRSAREAGIERAYLQRLVRKHGLKGSDQSAATGDR